MPLLQPTTPRQALRLIDRMLADERLLALVEATRSTGLAALERHAVRLRHAMGVPEWEQVTRILAGWGGLPEADPVPATGSRDERLARLRDIAQDRWDLRCGRERDRIPISVDLLPAPVAELVMGLAREWGMVGPLPASGAFGAAVVLGGYFSSTLNRSAAAAALQRESVTFPLVVGLASQRPLPAAERRQAAALGSGAGTEADAMALGLARAFGVDPDQWQGVAGEREQIRGDGLRLVVTEVPLHPDGSRPNTGESFAWLLRRHRLDVADGVLSVTTPIYWIQNHSNLLTRLPQRGTRLVTAGGNVEPVAELRPIYRSQHYLQEIKAAIDALPALLAWASA
jgi:hypothetical protein